MLHRQSIEVHGDHQRPDCDYYQACPDWNVTTIEQHEQVCWRATLEQEHLGWATVFSKV